MKSLFKTGLFILSICLPASLLAQSDSLRLICPLNDATVVPPPANQVKFDQQDLCIVLVSIPDSVVKAIGTGRITNVEYTEESGNGVVLFSRINGKEYYFWYTGMNKVIVRRNDAVKVGQPIGYVTPGERIELTMYEFETPIDPLKHLSCKEVLKRGF
jgi:hypothetical protein